MRNLCLLAAFVVISLPNAFGDGLVRDLPSNGQWSSYRMSEQWSDGTKRELKVTIKNQSDKSNTPSDQAWIEIVFETLDGKTRSAYRFLTPTESISNGDPMTAAVDVWVRTHDGESSRDMAWGNFLPRLSLVCMPKLTNEKNKHEAESITVNGETLTCPLISGKYSKATDRETASANCVLATSDRVPFGVAHATYAVRCIGTCDPDPTAQCNLSTGTADFRITDFGNDAVSLVNVTPKDDE